jgi:hypothetical protein
MRRGEKDRQVKRSACEPRTSGKQIAPLSKRILSSGGLGGNHAWMQPDAKGAVDHELWGSNQAPPLTVITYDILFDRVRPLYIPNSHVIWINPPFLGPIAENNLLGVELPLAIPHRCRCHVYDDAGFPSLTFVEKNWRLATAVVA